MNKDTNPATTVEAEFSCNAATPREKGVRRRWTERGRKEKETEESTIDSDGAIHFSMKLTDVEEGHSRVLRLRCPSNRSNRRTLSDNSDNI